MSSIHPHDFQTPPPFSMFSPARGRGKTTPYIPTAKAGSFTAILGKRLRELCPSDTVLHQVITKTFTDHHGFMVHTESFYPKEIETARYIGRYPGMQPLPRSKTKAKALQS